MSPHQWRNFIDIEEVYLLSVMLCFLHTYGRYDSRVESGRRRDENNPGHGGSKGSVPAATGIGLEDETSTNPAAGCLPIYFFQGNAIASR